MPTTICCVETENQIQDALAASDIVLLEEMGVSGVCGRWSICTCTVVVKDSTTAQEISKQASSLWDNRKETAARLNVAAYFFVNYGKDEIVEMLQLLFSEIELKHV